MVKSFVSVLFRQVGPLFKGVPNGFRHLQGCLSLNRIPMQEILCLKDGSLSVCYIQVLGVTVSSLLKCGRYCVWRKVGHHFLRNLCFINMTYIAITILELHSYYNIRVA